MKRLILFVFFLNIIIALNAQKFITKNGYIGFYSHTSVEEIKGDNNQVVGIFDTSTGEMVFQALVKSFHFDRALMEEHFNENYMESDKYPKSVFKGKIANINSVNFKKPGEYPVTVKGTLEIHGVSKDVETPGTFKVLSDETVTSSATFS